MKKLLFLAFLLVAGVSVNAQTAKSCSKKCAKTCTKAAKAEGTATAATTQVASQMTEAQIAAESDENIKMKECSVSGTQSFYEKSVCSKSGSVSWNEVEYCTKSKKFTQVAAASMERSAEGKVIEDAKSTKKKACSKTCKKTCSKKKASTL